MPEHLFNEKRDFMRMRIDAQVTYRINNEIYYGQSRNLSASGLYMTTDQAMTAGDLIELMMKPSGDTLPLFSSKGQVVQCVPDHDDPEIFHVSIKLIK